MTQFHQVSQKSHFISGAFPVLKLHYKLHQRTNSTNKKLEPSKLSWDKDVYERGSQVSGENFKSSMLFKESA